jgi:nucleotide-binding universal stress UspA family protein
MRRYRNILVAVDGSEAGFHALEESIRLAQWGKGGATVIHVAPSYEGDLSLVGVKNIKDAVDGPGEAILEEAMEIAKLHDFPISAILARGEVHERIAEYALTKDVDLIVLGAKKTPPIVRLFAGRVLAELMAISSKDVLVIPHQATIRWDKVLFPTDSSANDEKAATRVIDIARSYGSELRILLVTKALVNLRGKVSVSSESNVEEHAIQYLEDIHMEAERANVKSESRMIRGRFTSVVSRIASDEDASMIAIGPRKRTRAVWRFGRTPVTSLVYSSPCPVLLLQGPGA